MTAQHMDADVYRVRDSAGAHFCGTAGYGHCSCGGLRYDAAGQVAGECRHLCFVRSGCVESDEEHAATPAA